MKIIHVETLISAGDFPQSTTWKRVRRELHKAVKATDWPPGSGKFTIYPQSGKKRGEGNGVKQIKNECIRLLIEKGWTTEESLKLAAQIQLGGLDAMRSTVAGPVVLEWETGNISSSHRALNKMAIGLMKGLLVGASLVVPSRNLYKWLTDRVGNYSELVPYLDLWRAIRCKNGVLEIIVVEHDAESLKVPRIPKGNDGRALN